jgi:hypothetical protein
MKAKTIWWILGLGVLGLLAWIGLRAYRNHLRREEEMGEYENEGVSFSDSASVAQNHSKMAPETADEGA